MGETRNEIPRLREVGDPEAGRAMFRLMLELLAGLGGKIVDFDKEIVRRAREDEGLTLTKRGVAWKIGMSRCVTC